MTVEHAPPFHVISLGAGVQSSAMALMAAAGEIQPMPAAAIFADTQDEPAAVMEWLARLAINLPFKTHRVFAPESFIRCASSNANRKKTRLRIERAWRLWHDWKANQRK